MNDQNQRGGGGYLNGLLTGLIFGAAAVFFLGTKQGRRIAKKARRHGKKGLKELEELLAEIEDKGQIFAQKAQIATQQLQAKAQDAREDIAQLAQKELTHIQKLQEKGRAVSQKFFHRNGKSLG